MLYNVSYKSSNEVKQLLVSGSNISTVIIYCDANDITPSSISKTESNLILNNPSSQESYTVTLVDPLNVLSSAVIYDSFANVVSWINSQTGKSLRSIGVQIKPFVNA